MAKGIVYVETRPATPERAAEYNTWYDEVHLPEVVAVDGFVSARRYAPVNDDGPYVAMYEIEGDDLQAILQGMLEVAGGGGFRMSDAMQADPPPTIRLLELTTSYEPESAGSR